MNRPEPAPWSTQEFGSILREIAATTMPFGRYGPEKCPPNGLGIASLPLEYLLWMKGKDAFPRNRLGELLRTVCEIKEAGCEEFLRNDIPARRQKSSAPTFKRKIP